jgi:hypothetical protein
LLLVLLGKAQLIQEMDEEDEFELDEDMCVTTPLDDLNELALFAQFTQGKKEKSISPKQQINT